MATGFDCWKLAEEALAHDSRVLLYGPPGTGKTYAGTRFGDPSVVYSLTLDDEGSPIELRGGFLPGPGGVWGWMDGPAVRAWRESHDGSVRLVLNEIDHASPAVMSTLHAILDDPEHAALTLPTGETVRPNAANLQVVATMNGEPEDLTEALADRFGSKVRVNSPAPGSLDALPPDLRGMAERTATHADDRARMTMREWHSFAKLRAKVGMEIAAALVWQERAEDLIATMSLAAIGDEAGKRKGSA